LDGPIKHNDAQKAHTETRGVPSGLPTETGGPTPVIVPGSRGISHAVHGCGN
jgi:hypothetical protein